MAAAKSPDSSDPNASPVQLVRAMQAEIGPERLARWCVGLMSGRIAYDDPSYPPLPRLAGAGAAWDIQVGNLEERGSDYWPRVWGARGLLHGWDPSVAGEAVPALVGALDDSAWRVREMAAKVIRRWEVAEAADRLARLVDDATPRVRVAAVRALAVVGESEHLEAISSALDDDEATVRSAAEQALDRLNDRLDRSPDESSATPRKAARRRPASETKASRPNAPAKRPATRRRPRAPFSADDFDLAVASAVAALRPVVDRDWDVTAGDLVWTCAKTCAHIGDDLFAFAAQLAARVPSGYVPFMVSPRRKTAPAGLLNIVEAGAALVALAVRAAPPDARGFHPWGVADAEGTAALSAAEVIVHTYDIASGLGVAYEADGTHCRKIIERLGRDIDLSADDLADAESWPLLLWAAGRHDLPGRPRRTRWRWWPAPVDE